MYRMLALAVALLVVAPAAPASAQLTAQGPVVYGHHHLAVSSVDEHKKFWIGALGGAAGTFGKGTEIIKFPNALIFMRVQKPTGGSKGTTVDHIAFSVTNLRQVVDRIKGVKTGRKGFHDDVPQQDVVIEKAVVA